MMRRIVNGVYAATLLVFLAWLTFAALNSLDWCGLRDFGHCLRTTLLISGMVGIGPMLVIALIGGIAIGVLGTGTRSG